MYDFHVESYVMLEQFEKADFHPTKLASIIHKTIEHFAASYVSHSTETFETDTHICAVTEVRFRFAGPIEKAERLKVWLYETRAQVKDVQKPKQRLEYVLRGHPGGLSMSKASCEFISNGKTFNYTKALFPMSHALYGSKRVSQQTRVYGFCPDNSQHITMRASFRQQKFKSDQKNRIVLPRTRVSKFIKVKLENPKGIRSLNIARFRVELHRFTCTRNLKQDTVFFPEKPVCKHNFLTLLDKRCSIDVIPKADDPTEAVIPDHFFKCLLPLVEPTSYSNECIRSYGIKIMLQLECMDTLWSREVEVFLEIQIARLEFKCPSPSTRLLYPEEKQKTEKFRSIETFDRFKFYPTDVTEDLYKKVERKGLVYQGHKMETLTSDGAVCVFSTVSAVTPRRSPEESMVQAMSVLKKNRMFYSQASLVREVNGECMGCKKPLDSTATAT
ncbi:hypothetical protein FT663_04222 [Candidozyma haemuli var. vulneris]|uniref:Uncharacterized protein n=1 Tax=Candidozyma haemuli TaxID=45357 RepID=A0A2V1ARU8_9ASCO|nr:hypothetical protein CXQ85_004318 [[Candida] haemuloni]KAF3987995.1 hypothetical protein FT663_04222 [[Candida] haemuloni var. vulneris]KAF3991780.1 hypothetical protein FT662_01534 [[Candida] haemuloni var. vulneris]PVH20810.1 hypothetical protein CXQ85_004318 [[Candida] haemuloni]